MRTHPAMGALAALVLLWASAAPGADREPPGSELWLFGGMQGGLSLLGGTSGTETSKSGWNLGFKALASKYTPKWVFDGGLGWFHDQQSNSTGGRSVRVKTNAGFADLGARYRLSPQWQLGPVVQILFGPDVNFSEATASGTETSFAAMGGVRIEREFMMKSSIARVGFQAVTDLTISLRQVTWLQLDLQIGIPLSREESTPPPAPEPAPEPIVDLPVPPMEPVPETIFPARVAPGKEVVITLSDVLFHFDTASAKLKPSSIRRLEKLSYYLLQNNDAWKALRVDGHTDRRGTLAYNTRLSKRRANSVAQQLIKGGTDKAKLKVNGYGPTRPVDPAKNHVAYAKNRRVEVVLEGVDDPARLAKEINALAE